MISVVVSRLKSLALSVESSDKSALPPSDLTVTPTVLWLIPERQFAILDHKALETKTILKYLNLTTISYDLIKISNSWILNFLKNLYESSLFQAFCQWSVPRSQSAAEKKRGDGAGGDDRGGNFRSHSHPYAVFPAHISLHCPHNLNAWNGIVRVEQTIFLVAQSRFIWLSNLLRRGSLRSKRFRAV